MNPELDMSQPVGGANAGSSYVVQRGDSLWKIAEKTLGDGRRWKELAALNGVRNPDLIRPGQVIRLPGGGGPDPRMRPSATAAATPPPVPVPIAAGANMSTIGPDIRSALADPKTAGIANPGWNPGSVDKRPNPTDPRAIMMRQMMGQ